MPLLYTYNGPNGFCLLSESVQSLKSVSQFTLQDAKNKVLQKHPICVSHVLPSNRLCEGIQPWITGPGNNNNNINTILYPFQVCILVFTRGVDNIDDS